MNRRVSVARSETGANGKQRPGRPLMAKQTRKRQARAAGGVGEHSQAAASRSGRRAGGGKLPGGPGGGRRPDGPEAEQPGAKAARRRPAGLAEPAPAAANAAEAGNGAGGKSLYAK